MLYVVRTKARGFEGVARTLSAKEKQYPCEGESTPVSQICNLAV